MRRILALLVILAMLVSFTGCGQTEPAASYSDTEPSGSIDSGNDSDESTTTAAAGGTSANKTKGTTKTPVIQTQKPATTTTGKPVSNNTGTITSQPKPEDIVISGDKIETEKAPELENTVEIVTAHTPLAAAEYYQYSTLEANEKMLYSRFKEAVEKAKNTVDAEELHISSRQATMVMRRFMADYPHYFWLSRMFYILHTGDENDIKGVRLLYTDGAKQDNFDDAGNITDLADRKVIADQIDALSKKINDILATIPTNATAIEKEKAIHDYILDSVIYDDDAVEFSGNGPLPHAYDIYGAACEGKAVCEGYSKLFQYLCYCVGINATQVNGQSMGEGHMWNATLIDGEWYHVDVTWDDGTDVPYYKYFNVTTDELKKDHEIDDDELSLPNCHDQSAAYYMLFTMRVTSLNKAPANLEKVTDLLAKNKENYLILHVEIDNMPPDEYFLKYLLGEGSTLGRYIRRKGYTFSVGYSLHIYDNGEYIYIPIERRK